MQEGRLSRGEEIFPDFHKVEGENAAFSKQPPNIDIHSIDKFSISLLTINLPEIDI